MTPHNTAEEASYAENLAAETQAEATPTAALTLLKPVQAIRNRDRLRFIARAKDIMAIVGDEGDGELDFENLPAEALDKIGDFMEYVVDKFARDEASADKLEALDFGEYMAVLFTYLERMGESMGSSN